MPRDLEELDRWIDEHPRLAWVYTIGLGILILELAGIIEQLELWASR